MEDICSACGIELDDSGIVDFFYGKQFCSHDCRTSGKTFEAIETDNPLTVQVKGKCDGRPIKGTATFSIHGECFLEFTDPQLKGSFVVPEQFLKIVSMLYADEEEIAEECLKK